MAKILVVEDDENLSTLIAFALRKGGHLAQVAADGIQAMGLARQFKPDLVILDYMFPAGGGEAFFKRLRLSVHTSQLPILVLTAVPLETVAESVRSDPRTVCMNKPYNGDEFLKKVNDILAGPPH